MTRFDVLRASTREEVRDLIAMLLRQRAQHFRDWKAARRTQRAIDEAIAKELDAIASDLKSLKIEESAQ